MLAAARASFAEQGYDGTTIRGVAARAGVDPALVHYFFGSKQDLFAAAMQLPVTPAALADAAIDGGVEGIGERIIRLVVHTWDDPATSGPMLAMLRSAASHELSARTLREFLTGEVLGRIAAAIDLPDATTRAALAATQIVGLVMARYVLRIEPIASADEGTLAGYLGPSVQRYLSADLTPAATTPTVGEDGTGRRPTV